jgi:hypothetical protein
VQVTNDSLLEAFTLLETCVRHLCSYGRLCLGARLKPELYRRSNYNFSEQRLGFAKFGDFLRAAERQGTVRLVYTPGGDWAVSPGTGLPPQPTYGSGATTQGPSPLTAQVRPASASSTFGPALRVRDDLWNAFNSFSAQWFYDRNTDAARQVPKGSEAQIGFELIPIPSGRDRVVDWMRSFAATQDDTVKAQLLGVLSSDSPIYRFKGAINIDPNLTRAWRRYHIQQVLAAIEAWAASNNVHPKNVTMPFLRARSAYWAAYGSAAPAAAPVQVPTPESIPSSQQPPAGTLTPATLTPRLASLIDELIDNLLRLRGTLQVMDKH